MPYMYGGSFSNETNQQLTIEAIYQIPGGQGK